MQILKVHFGLEIVGMVCVEKNNWTFQYSKEWLAREDVFPVSVSLPLQSNLFEHESVRNFFANLLPEATIREKLTKYYGISSQNDFGLLKACGGECAGALSVIPENETCSIDGEYILLTEDMLYQKLTMLKQIPFLVAMDECRLSLAGAQHKLPVYMKDDDFFLPLGSFASTHIIKPDVDGYDGIVNNEAFCMTLAGRVGLDVPDVEVVNIKEKQALLITRYDRVVGDDNVIRRRHQEDFCQALGVSYDQKYESEGGPSLENCFGLLDQCSIQPLLDKKKLLEWVIFNCCIGNADAHGKNVSLLYDKRGVSLAPFYDLVSTIVYPGLSKKMAMKIGRENQFSWIKQRHWERLAEMINFKKRIVLEMVDNLQSRMRQESQKLEEEFSKKGLLDDKIKFIVTGLHSGNATGLE